MRAGLRGAYRGTALTSLGMGAAGCDKLERSMLLHSAHLIALAQVGTETVAGRVIDGGLWATGRGCTYDVEEEYLGGADLLLAAALWQQLCVHWRIVAIVCATKFSTLWRYCRRNVREFLSWASGVTYQWGDSPFHDYHN